MGKLSNWLIEIVLFVLALPRMWFAYREYEALEPEVKGAENIN